MPLVVGIRFKPGGKLHYFDPGTLTLGIRDMVVVDTLSGPAVGGVTLPARELTVEQIGGQPRSVLRVATPADIARRNDNQQRETKALRICAERVRARALPMKLLDAEFTLDGNQVTIHFAAENRVDFRELVRDVATAIHTRVIFHQVGVRDHARALGLYGHCGQQLCCARFLNSLEPVSMKMAKDQSLAINPSKFSGVCGKLMCCLRFEHDCYRESLEELPHAGSVVETDRGQAEVVVNPLAATFTARLADGTLGLFNSDGTAACAQCCCDRCADERQPTGDEPEKPATSVPKAAEA